MEIRPSSQRVVQANVVPLRRQLHSMRRAVAVAIEEDAEIDQETLDKLLDLEWLASLPRNLPRGSIVNILV